MSYREIYKFGAFALDAKAKVLLRNEQAVGLTRKGVETLQVLVENAGQVVTKDELLRAIWPDRVVEEANLTQNIAMVRKALSADIGTAAYIETFPGRGYRLTGPVTTEVISMHEPLVVEPSVELASSFSGDVNLLSDRSGSYIPRKNDSLKIMPRLSRYVLWGIAIFGFIGWWWFTRNKPVKPTESNFSVTPLTRLAGEEHQAVLSPDGRHLAFLWQQGDGRPPTLCIQTHGSNTHQAISATGQDSAGEGNYSSPAWSPDGRALAYLRTTKAATEICLRAIADGTERVVTRFVPPNYGTQRRLLDWSPDGQWIVVAHAPQTDKPNGLHLVNVASGEQRKLTEPEQMAGGDTDPLFSPDSQSLVFIRNFHRSHQELFTLDLKRNKVAQQTNDSKQISSVAWSRDGAQLFFASNRGGEYRLWRMTNRRDTNEKPGIQANVQAEAIYNEFPIEFALARQSDTLVYSLQPQNRNIWQFDLQQKTWLRLIVSSAQDASPQYSPDGQHICFRSDRSGQEHIWVSDRLGRYQTQVTNEILYPSVGNWSPDGKQIIFNNGRTGALYLAEQKEGKWLTRALNNQGVHPVFSLDGQALFAGSTERLQRIPLAGGVAKTLLPSGGFSLSLSADGQWLYFMRATNDTTLWKLNTVTAEFKQALSGIVPQCTSCWALAHNGIYYLGSSSASFDAQSIYFQDFASGRIREIIKYPEPLAPIGSGPFSLSPDGRYLLVVRTDPAESDILSVTPFR